VSQQINLFNPIFLRQEKYFSAAAGGQAIGLLIVGMLSFYAYAVFEMDGLTRQVSVLERQQRAAQERLAKVTAEFGVKPADAALAAQVRELQSGLASRQSLLTALSSGSFGAERGLSEYMRALARQSVPGLWLTGFNVEEGGGNFSISGLAVSPDLVPTFVRGLGTESTMRGRTLDNLAMSRQSFSVTPARAAQAVQVPVVAFVLSSGMGSSGVPEREETPPSPATQGNAAPPGAAKAGG
jgi:hypothetical protein